MEHLLQPTNYIATTNRSPRRRRHHTDLLSDDSIPIYFPIVDSELAARSERARGDVSHGERYRELFFVKPKHIIA